MKQNFNSGFGVIEAIVGIAVGSILLVAFASLIWQTMKMSRANVRDFKAQLYLKELVEVIRDLEQSNWQEIANTFCTEFSPCFPQISGGNWDLVSGSKENLEGIFERWIVIEDTADTQTKKVTAKLEWNNGFENKNLKTEIYVYSFNP